MYRTFEIEVLLNKHVISKVLKRSMVNYLISAKYYDKVYHFCWGIYWACHTTWPKNNWSLYVYIQYQYNNLLCCIHIFDLYVLFMPPSNRLIWVVTKKMYNLSLYPQFLKKSSLEKFSFHLFEWIHRIH